MNFRKDMTFTATGNELDGSTYTESMDYSYTSTVLLWSMTEDGMTVAIGVEYEISGNILYLYFPDDPSTTESDAETFVYIKQ